MTDVVRVIACLDVADGRVVKGVKFEELRDAGDPVALAKLYNDAGVDELTFLDISASVEERQTTIDMVRRTAEQVFVPLTVGGGVRDVADVTKLLASGADKVGMSTAAVTRPEVLTEIAAEFGNQVTVLSVDAKRSAATASGFEVTTHGGRKDTGLDVIAWCQQAEELGAGEVLLNSIDADGTNEGFDLELIERVRQAVQLPVIASGGAGTAAHFVEAARAGANAILAASVFHFQQLSIAEVKQALTQADFAVRQLSQ